MSREQYKIIHQESTSFNSGWALVCLLYVLLLLTSCRFGWYIRRVEYTTSVNPDTKETYFMKKEIVEVRVPARPAREVTVDVEDEHNEAGGEKEE